MIEVVTVKARVDDKTGVDGDDSNGWIIRLLVVTVMIKGDNKTGGGHLPE